VASPPASCAPRGTERWVPEREVGGAEATLELRPVGSGSSSTQSMDIVVSGFDIPHDGYLILLTGPFYARPHMPDLRARPSCARRRQLTHAHAPGIHGEDQPRETVPWEQPVPGGTFSVAVSHFPPGRCGAALKPLSRETRICPVLRGDVTP
jgi:hypothetical protein